MRTSVRRTLVSRPGLARFIASIYPTKAPRFTSRFLIMCGCAVRPSNRRAAELFEAIARLKAGDKLRVSGKLQRNKDCVKEVSITESGGIDTPEFRLAYTDINGAQRRGEAPSAEPEKREAAAAHPQVGPGSFTRLLPAHFRPDGLSMPGSDQGSRQKRYPRPWDSDGTSSSRDMTFLLRMSRWSGKVSPNNTILIAGDEAEAQNGLGNWLRVNYTCTVDLSNNTVKHATLNQGRLQ